MCHHKRIHANYLYSSEDKLVTLWLLVGVDLALDPLPHLLLVSATFGDVRTNILRVYILPYRIYVIYCSLNKEIVTAV